MGSTWDTKWQMGLASSWPPQSPRFHLPPQWGRQGQPVSTLRAGVSPIPPPPPPQPAAGGPRHRASEVLTSLLLGASQKAEALWWWSEARGDHSCIGEPVRLKPRGSQGLPDVQVAWVRWESLQVGPSLRLPSLAHVRCSPPGGALRWSAGAPPQVMVGPEFRGCPPPPKGSLAGLPGCSGLAAGPDLSLSSSPHPAPRNDPGPRGLLFLLRDPGRKWLLAQQPGGHPAELGRPHRQ